MINLSGWYVPYKVPKKAESINLDICIGCNIA